MNPDSIYHEYLAVLGVPFEQVPEEIRTLPAKDHMTWEYTRLDAFYRRFDVIKPSAPTNSQIKLYLWTCCVNHAPKYYAIGLFWDTLLQTKSRPAPEPATFHFPSRASCKQPSKFAKDFLRFLKTRL